MSETTEKEQIQKTGTERSAPGKDHLEILLILDWEHLEKSGVERTLSGLHRVLPVEKSRLHLFHIDHPATKRAEPEPMLSRIRTCLEKYDWKLAETRLEGLTQDVVASLITESVQAAYDLAVVCMPELPSGGQSVFSAFTQQFTSHAPISVLVWRKPLSEQPHAIKVLFAVDGSESSMTAMNRSADLLHLKYAELQAATVLTPIFQDNAVTAPFVNPDVLEQALDANANMIFEMAKGLLESRGLPKPACKKLFGSPATELGYYAELEAPDLIVVGSHNRKGLAAWLMGSVSSQLLQWDRHNLLVVR